MYVTMLEYDSIYMIQMFTSLVNIQLFIQNWIQGCVKMNKRIISIEYTTCREIQALAICKYY